MLEPNIYGLWAGKQTAKGTPNIAPGKRLVQVGGDFALNRDDGEENYSDLTKYGARTDWVNSLSATGEPACEATPTELAYALWLYHGAETVTAVTGPPTAQRHQFVPSTGRGHWATFFRRLGLTDVMRHQMNDSLIGRIQLEGSTANKAVRFTPRILTLDPYEVKTADPAAAMPAGKSFLYTDATSTFEMDDVVIRGQSQWQLVLDEDLSLVYGDDTNPYDIAQGTAAVTIGITLVFDSVGLARWNTLVYGSAAPVAGTKPLKRVPALGKYEFRHTQRDDAGALNGKAFDLVIPGVKWAIPEAPAPNPDGGPTEIALSGSMRPVVGQPAYTIGVETDNAVTAFTT